MDNVITSTNAQNEQIAGGTVSIQTIEIAETSQYNLEKILKSKKTSHIR